VLLQSQSIQIFSGTLSRKIAHFGSFEKLWPPEFPLAAMNAHTAPHFHLSILVDLVKDILISESLCLHVSDGEVILMDSQKDTAD